jgi:dTDP-4-dehydrorhamnose 3,5-epimerase
LIFHETELHGAWIIEPDLLGDGRGFFARVYCEDEFAAHDLASPMVQGNISYTAKAGTIRGMHYQLPPMMEAKYIRVLSGAIQDVIVDLRPWSNTYLQHIDVELSAGNRLGIYVPPLFAHGHQALTDDVEISYLVSRFYTPGLERGIRHDDPRLAIDWRRPVTSLSDKDAAWLDLDQEAVSAEILAAVDESGESVPDPADFSPEE